MLNPTVTESEKSDLYYYIQFMKTEFIHKHERKTEEICASVDIFQAVKSLKGLC